MRTYLFVVALLFHATLSLTFKPQGQTGFLVNKFLDDSDEDAGFQDNIMGVPIVINTYDYIYFS